MSTKFEKVTLRNVITPTGEVKNIEVELVPFNMRNDAHIEFAFNYSDMLAKLPSPFSTITEAAVKAVELFMVHKEQDLSDPESTYYAVAHDKRAARTFFNSQTLQQAIVSFFENA